MPLIILNPAEASLKQSLSATSLPYSEGVRVPTTAKGRVMVFKDLPFILETPIDENIGNQENIAKIRSFVSV